MLTEQGCAERQRRLRELLSALKADAAVIVDPREIYYFSGLLLPTLPFTLPGFLWFDLRGHSWLVAPREKVGGVVADRLDYDWNEAGTTSPDPVRRIIALVEQRLEGVRASRIAFQVESLPKSLADVVARLTGADDWIAVDDEIATMQKRKDPDEVACIRRCIQVNLAGYSAARAAIAPGVTELEVLAAGQLGAMLEAGESVYHNGDYRCGVYNGPARKQPIERGEIYIIDAQSCVDGYWSDLSRAFLVGDEPTTLQQSIFDHIAGIQAQVPGMLKPGADGRDVWKALDKLIREHPALAGSGLVHHGGHGVGIRLHEMPDLNRDRGGILEIGNVLSVEPGGYAEAARYGARIENMYLITQTGAQNLSEYQTQLI